MLLVIAVVESHRSQGFASASSQEFFALPTAMLSKDRPNLPAAF